ncbi:AAA family ATPase [Paenibacillus tianjinensis]|uniref:AAA family ATPase n=1 Tax=Paenibacillus tianjinensis TaxID=2810347 RepID=A0ABX7L5T4_9BACL|nr:AAA family ATPase [Paenibacillus tianjinensis]QSF43463.1 AAA family ATPase [Paenibacillus tianjinensis]
MAGFRKNVRTNIPKVDLQSYKTIIASGYKGGKTRLYKELTELHYPNEPEADLHIAFEPGEKSWHLRNTIALYDQEKPWEYFKNEIVRGLVEEAKTGSVTKLIGIDTVDRCIENCSDYIIELCSKKYGKKFTSLQDITQSTNENGYILLQTELAKQFDILTKIGIGFIYICWTKEKEVTTIDGVKYNSLELMMNATGKKVFESQADLICCLHTEVKVTDKKGEVIEENEKTKKGKEIASNFHTTEVQMYFRPSNYISIAGGRFTNLPEKVEYGAENFFKVFKEAVEGQIGNVNKSFEDIKSEEIINREEKAKEFAEAEDKTANAEDLIAQIDAETKRFTSNDLKEKVVPKFTELLGSPNYRKAEDVEKLEEALKFIKETK